MKRQRVKVHGLAVDAYRRDSGELLFVDIRSLELEHAGVREPGVPVLACEVAGLRDALTRAMEDAGDVSE